jgi:HlyD family secretion protein
MNKASSNALVLLRRRSEPDDPTLPAILEFQWPSTAIVNAPVPRSARRIVWIIASMFVVLVVLMGIIPIDQVVTARGIVVSEGRTILVQPLDTAIVRSIDVREGQQVRAGELLAKLDPTFAAADLAALTTQVSSLEAQVARLQAEAKKKPFAYDGVDPNWLLQAAIYGNRKGAFESKINNYTHRLDELTATISRAQSDAASYRERLGVAQNVEQMRNQLQSAHAGSRLDALLATDNRAEMARLLSNAQKSSESAKLERAALEADRDAFMQGSQAEVSQQLSATIDRANEAREQLNKAKLRRKLVELRSEHDAIVQSVAKVSVGSVLQSGQPLITLVPADAPLEVEADISGKENGYVHVQDPVVIKFDTFPYSQYGMAEGTVRAISPSSFTAQEEGRNPTSAAVPATPAATALFYRTRIAIERVALRNVPEGFHIMPGMPVSADIKVGKRTVLKYFLGAMMPVTQEGMREP